MILVLILAIGFIGVGAGFLCGGFLEKALHLVAGYPGPTDDQMAGLALGGGCVFVALCLSRDRLRICEGRLLMSTVMLHHGDSRDVLKTFSDNSIASVVCDPPYALVSIGKRFGADGAAPAQFGTDGAYARASAGFMGKKWDTGETAFAVEFWAEVLRVLKPGGHVVAFGGTRTYHRLACAIEDAGFEIRDQLAWVYGSGFCKSRNAWRLEAKPKIGICPTRARRSSKYSMEVICKGCGTSFPRRYSNPKTSYCTWECFKASRWALVTCAECGSEFSKRLCEIQKAAVNGHKHMCSRACRNAATSKLLGGDGTWAVGGQHGAARKRGRGLEIFKSSFALHRDKTRLSGLWRH